MDTFDLVPHVRDLAIAYGLAVPIGWDREREERTAGLRTFPLVAVASCAFIQASEHAGNGSNLVSGAVEGLIGGMGFIGVENPQGGAERARHRHRHRCKPVGHRRDRPRRGVRNLRRRRAGHDGDVPDAATA
jgi:hypothetical protein